MVNYRCVPNTHHLHHITIIATHLSRAPFLSPCPTMKLFLSQSLFQFFCLGYASYLFDHRIYPHPITTDTRNGDKIWLGYTNLFLSHVSLLKIKFVLFHTSLSRTKSISYLTGHVIKFHEDFGE